jgi:hypothetical protein|tara:strand:+ start:2330 stop:2467 length:138 start_codon:yes stop_codon:yes gene_type:complete
MEHFKPIEQPKIEQEIIYDPEIEEPEKEKKKPKKSMKQIFDLKSK